MVHVELEDHRHEEFVKPIQKIKPFAGKGQTLGSPAPEVNTTALQQTSAVTSETNTQNEARYTRKKLMLIVVRTNIKMFNLCLYTELLNSLQLMLINQRQ